VMAWERTGRGACGFACVWYFFPGAFPVCVGRLGSCGARRAGLYVAPHVSGTGLRYPCYWVRIGRPRARLVGGWWDRARVCRGRIRLVGAPQVVWVVVFQLEQEAA
jgi:hypothetical protein